MNAPNQQTINILIVVCSLEQTRYDMSKIVLDSIAKLLNTISNYKIYILENGSTFQLRKSDIPFSCTLLRMKKNLGYWSALYLFLKYLSNKNDEAGYIYLVESDNLHYNLARLDTARNFLNHNPSIVSVRSQEFNIRLRSFFSKESVWSKIGFRRSKVSLVNPVNSEKANFQKVQDFPDIYISNLHTKLPSIHRVNALREAFDELAQYSEFTEIDFFNEMHNISNQIGVINRGCYYSLSIHSTRDKVPAGSWIDDFEGEVSGYLPTRLGRIENSYKKPEDLISEIIEI